MVIIRDESIRIKIIRDVKFCQKIKSHKVSKKQKEVFLRKLETLFDILHCKCPILACTSGPCYSVCPGVHIDCKCERDKKIPTVELPFILDQRTKQGHKGRMQMQIVDMKESKRQELSIQKKLFESSVQKDYKERCVTDDTLSDYQYDETDHSDGVVDD